jgi:predicted phage terminase large subunit-like protein|tara:strand:+ start:415 stop:2058 length:1644 start_codon:yes stop_codon:yes gene_type:complete
VTDLKKLECYKCKKLLAENLVLPKGLCVYCAADEADQLPQPQKQPKISKKEENAQIKAEKELALRILSRKRMLPFVEKFNPDYQAGWVHKDVCRRLEKFSQDVAEKKSPRLMLFMPPRHGKSTLASIAFPAWHLGRNPGHEFISCSYSGSLAMSFSRKVRQVLREPNYKNVFESTKLDKDSQSVESWQTTEGGGYVAAGVGGGITGKGAHVLLIDDPVKNREDAESENNREATWDWYTSTAYTRLSPGGGILVILTRWHDDDLAGKLLTAEEDGADAWEVVKYPAIAEEDEEFRASGEPLHPERYNLESLEMIQRAIGPRDWTALYQQNPVSDEGDYFTRDMVRYYEPDEIDYDRLRYYCAWDLAIGQRDRNDFSVGLVVGIDEYDNMFVVDLVRGKYDGYELVEKILDLYEQWRPGIVGIERGHIEMAIGPFLEKRVAERRLHSAYFKDLKVGRRDKEARARAIQGRMQQGKVYFPADSVWTGTMVAELLRFPNGVHDDQVDALAWVGLMIMEYATFYEAPEHVPSWRDRLELIAKGPKKKTAMSA